MLKSMQKVTLLVDIKRHTKASVQKLNNCFSQAFKDALNEEIIERDQTWNDPIYEGNLQKRRR